MQEEDHAMDTLSPQHVRPLRWRAPTGGGRVIAGLVLLLGCEPTGPIPEASVEDAPERSAGMGEGGPSDIRFADETARAGAAVPTDGRGYGHGVAAADFDGDGLTDLYVVVYQGANALLRNNGDGTFTDMAAQAAVRTSPELGDRGVAAADYDADGDVDLHVTTASNRDDLLFRNRGDGTFSEWAAIAGLTNYDSGGNGVSWGDYDGDGDLDVFLCGNFNDDAQREDLREVLSTLAAQPVAPWNDDRLCHNRLFRQESGGAFVDATLSSGLGEVHESVQSVFFDLEGDGDLDLFVTRLQGFPNLLYVNDGVGGYVEEAEARGIDDPAADGQGASVADYDGDGDFDIYMASARGGSRLYRNDGSHFTDVAEASGVRDDSRSLGCHFEDFDNDGWVDLYVVNFGGNRMFRNNGDGTFTDVTARSGAETGTDENGHGSAVLDYDADGRLDVFVSNSGQRSRLFHNVGPINHWLRVALASPSANRQGIGARVVLDAGGRRQSRQLLSGSANLSGGSELSVHFGLGESSRVDRLEVIWPSGTRDVLLDVAADQTLVVQEGSFSGSSPQ